MVSANTSRIVRLPPPLGSSNTTSRLIFNQTPRISHWFHFFKLGSGGVTISQASTSVSLTVPSFSRTRPVAPLPSRQQQSHSHLLLPQSLEDGGDDGIVPSTPTLYVPRRSDGFGEAVSSPHVPTSGRFTFSESAQPNVPGSSEIVPEQSLEPGSLDDTSMKRCLGIRNF